MDIENTIGEQPTQDQTLQIGEVDNTEDKVEIESENGSLGKFKDADTLLNAYNSLQAEFTRKCQRLKQLEKETEEKLEAEINNDQSMLIPLYERENWTEIVADFLAKNQDAKQYSQEICNEIMEHKDEYKEPNALDNAYSKILKRHLVQPETIANDGQFINDYILSNQEIKKRVMEIYLNELSNNKPPKVISKDFGGSILINKHPQPQSLEEAKSLVKQLIEI